MELKEKIKDLREKADLSQSALARLLKVSPQTVQKWESGETHPKTKRLEQLAAALGCNVFYLMANENFEPDTKITKKIPLLSWVQAGNPQLMEEAQSQDGTDEHVHVVAKVSDEAYALTVIGDSMLPLFPEKSIIVVDPKVEVTNQCYVVVRFDDQNTATFKQLVFEGNKKFLKPLNERYPIQEINSNASLLGVVVQQIQTFI